MRGNCYESERGFVLPTALIMISLLTLMAVAMLYTARSSLQVSSTAESSTQGHYFAETAVNYMVWAMRNDAEFDAFDFRGAPVNDANAVDPNIFSDLPPLGDWSKLTANFTDPGPTSISDTLSSGVSGQVMYFDNTKIANRAVCWPTSLCNAGNLPTMYHISKKLPRYIRLDIDSAGVVTPSIPALPHAAVPIVGDDIPDNGAIVWLTTGNSTMDFEVDSTLAACSGTPPSDALACDKNPPTNNPTGWLRTAGVLPGGEDQYGVVVYAIGYVRGNPSSIVRAEIK